MNQKYQSTLPSDPASLMRISEFHRQQSGEARDAAAGGTRLSSLNPSLLQDLQRFAGGDAPPGRALDLIEVLAAAIRHARPLLVHLQHEYRVVPLTVFPVERQMHAPVPQRTLLAWRLPELRVLHVEPARVAPPVPGRDHPEAPLFAPLEPLLWELALRGGRDRLLPEIGGTAAYRVAPGVDLMALEASGSLAAAVQRLRRQTTGLREIEQWPGFDRERAMRLLNGLYLQAALIVSRTHPAATDDERTDGPAA